jgi:hypothetical protein
MRRLRLRSLALAICSVALLVAAFPAAAEPASRAASKACAVAQARVAQQQRAVADIDLRIERERRVRSLCGSQKACRRSDQRIDSLQDRRTERETRLARLRTIEARDCPSS